MAVASPTLPPDREVNAFVIPAKKCDNELLTFAGMEDWQSAGAEQLKGDRPMLVTQMFRQKKAHRIITIPPEMTIVDAVEILKKEHIGALMVMGDDGVLAGILSERDIVRALPEYGAGFVGVPVEKLMTSPVVTCGPEAHVDDIMKTMTAKHFRHMPVLEDGRLIGMISIGDVVKSRLDELESESLHMHNYIAGIE